MARQKLQNAMAKMFNGGMTTQAGFYHLKSDPMES